MKNPRTRNSIFTIGMLILITITMVYSMNGQLGRTEDPPTINQVAQDIKNGEIAKIIESDDRVTVYYVDEPNQKVTFLKEDDASLVEQLHLYGVTEEYLDPSNITVEIAAPSIGPTLLNIFFTGILPILLMVGVFLFFMRNIQGSNNQAMSFGKSKAKMFTGENPTVTFKDVAGVEEAKEDLYEIVEFLREPQKFIALGARIPKGVLMVGSPGTGKTLMAKAISGEAGVPFFSISGSDFVEMFVGVGASRVRDLFEQAKRHAPAIIFVDEIDAVGRHRGAGMGGSHDEREQTLNQILVEMDGFETNTNVIIIAATNRPDILDPALLRAGRFDRQVVLDAPDMKGREAIFKVHMKGKPVDSHLDVSVLAKATPGMVGADIENVVNEGAIIAARKDKRQIELEDFQEAIERVMVGGRERKSRVIAPDEKRIVAYHEAGHAIVMNALPEADPVHKVTIIPRGMAGGYTLALPEQDHNMLASRRKLITEMVGLLGGRAAESIVFNDITSGASNDIERVTKIARAMVTRYGMSEEMGPMIYGQSNEMVFLGREISEQRDYSENVAEKIDAEVSKLVSQAYTEAKDILTKYRAELDAVAQRLIEVETIDRKEFERLFPTPVEKNSGTPAIA